MEVIYDDRAAGFGVKMNDYELIGYPYALIVGKKAGDNLVEFAVRESGERLDLSPEAACEKLEALCR